MQFEQEKYTVEQITLAGETVEIRAFRNRVYVDKPVNREFQQMNIFAPEDYYRGKSINGYDLHTAPIFMPNTVGGYMPGPLAEPEISNWGNAGEPNSIFQALRHGYVVAAPAIRGRVQQNGEGIYTGKAPACIVDYKAAVRYLRYFSEEIPGDVEKIITSGTSAGGALSSLMGVTGNHPDYEPYLEKIGAAKTGDHIFAASCYCPITNLEHADMAYEWQFVGVNGYWGDKQLDEKQIKVSEELAKAFPAYANSLNLKDKNGLRLSLDEKGDGSLKEYVKNKVLESAKKAMDRGADIFSKIWLNFENGEPVSVDWKGYVCDIARLKPAPSFDGLLLNTAENDLFGSEMVNLRHFTKYGREHSLCGGEMAEEMQVKLMNPMNYIEDEMAMTAKYFRIRHGECDRDTSLVISAMLTLKLEEQGKEVDYHLPWGLPHSGDYDLDELFEWIDGICKD